MNERRDLVTMILAEGRARRELAAKLKGGGQVARRADVNVRQHLDAERRCDEWRKLRGRRDRPPQRPENAAVDEARVLRMA